MDAPAQVVSRLPPRPRPPIAGASRPSRCRRHPQTDRSAAFLPCSQLATSKERRPRLAEAASFQGAVSQRTLRVRRPASTGDGPARARVRNRAGRNDCRWGPASPRVVQPSRPAPSYLRAPAVLPARLHLQPSWATGDPSPTWTRDKHPAPRRTSRRRSRPRPRHDRRATELERASGGWSPSLHSGRCHARSAILEQKRSRAHGSLSKWTKLGSPRCATAARTLHRHRSARHGVDVRPDTKSAHLRHRPISSVRRPRAAQSL